MNIAVFGKTIDKVKNRMELKLTAETGKTIKWLSKLLCIYVWLCDGPHTIDMHNKELVHDNSLFVGTSSLDMSKLCTMGLYLQHHPQGL